MNVDRQRLKRTLEQTGREIGDSFRRVGAQARDTVRSVDVDQLRRRLGTLEERLNRGIDVVSNAVSKRARRWLGR